MSNNSVWNGPRLLVPITVDALVITQIPNTATFSIKPLELANYKKFRNISPELFNGVGELDPGIYLNWALPDGMTKGTVNDEGRVTYPYLPNRWMITRFGTDNRDRAAWVVESDELSDSRSPGGVTGSRYINNKDGAPEVKFIGKVTEVKIDDVVRPGKERLVAWTEKAGDRPLILTATGNSDPLFAAYAGNNSLVFSFIDPVVDSNAHHYSYMVTGWFSNPGYDILHSLPKTDKAWKDKTSWMAAMNRLQWSIGGQAIEDNIDLDNAIAAGKRFLDEQQLTPFTGIVGKLPSQTLCHGLVFDVVWPGMTKSMPNRVPRYDTTSQSVPYVAAANAATDCLAAFMQWQLNYNSSSAKGDDSEVEIILEAFSNKMLPQPGGVLDTPELTNAIREAWFGRLPGGIKWVAQIPPKNGELKPGNNSSEPAELDAVLAREVAALNDLQYAFDDNYRKLITLQKQLYADWLKLNMDKNSQSHVVPKAVLETALARSLAAVQALQAKMPADEAVIKNIEAGLGDRLKAKGGFTLTDKPANDFYRPVDPVLLVNNAKRSFKRGEDIIYSEFDDFLFTRFSGQFITSIKTRPGNGVKVIQATDICPPVTPNPDIPAEFPFLLREACMLDTNFATVIAAKAMANPDVHFIDYVKRQQTLIWNSKFNAPVDQRTLEDLSGFNADDELFRIPSKVGVSKWVQPWTPLYLEWQIGFISAVDTNLSQWEFDGTDFNWKDTLPIPLAGDEKIFSGRSILTPKEAITLQARLKEFINDFEGTIPPDYVPLQDVLNGVGNWDVLSQTLTGFTMKLLQWDIEQFGYQPQDGYAPAIGDEAHGMVLVNNEKNFYPVRAGFVNIQKLWIVDDFGQVYDLMTGFPDQSNNFYPIPGIGVRPGDYEINRQLPNCFQLPPRVVQGSRLNFDFLSAGDDNIFSNQSSQTSPVCGWMLPNHLNSSAMVYDAAGVLIGELMLMGATGAYHAQWVPSPFDGCHADKITNAHLKGVVQGILNSATDQGSANSGKWLKSFMKAIDETLWTVDPMGERSNQSLSILVGRPVAVLRASVGLELYGEPGKNIAWTYSDKNDTGNIGKYNFPVQIGNVELGQDGVMGYYPDNDYSKFISVHNDLSDKDPNPYVLNRFAKLQPNAEPVYITILLDPRGAIHCSTGILPVLKTELPEMYIGKALDEMRIQFKAGPLVVDKKHWWLPLPAGVGQQWSWLQPYQESGGLEWSVIDDLVAANPVPQLSDSPLTLVEGRLKLTGVLGDQLMILFFEADIRQLPYQARAGSSVNLSWASQNAVAASLKIGTGAPVSVPVNQEGYPYVVTKTQELELTITGSDLKTEKLIVKITAI